MNLSRYLLIIIMAFFMSISAIGQSLRVISSIEDYTAEVKNDPDMEMVDLTLLLSTAHMDLRYSTPDNFTNTILYEPGFKVYLRKPAAIALTSVQQELEKQGLGLKIFDGYRPYDVTVKMWELIGDERYVANPAKGSGHNRGISVDVTIVNLQTGKELEMGTGYDHFSDTAHHSFTKLSPKVLQNREKLKSIMEKYGFKALETEWWHYQYVSTKNFSLMNLSPKQLKKGIL